MVTTSIEESEKKQQIRPIDEIDGQIISILRENSRTKNVEIARRVHLTEGGVRARISRLIRNGVIEKFTVVTRTNEVSGIVLVKTQLDQTKLVGKRLREMGIRIFETSGEYDLAVEVSAESTELLNAKVDTIRSLPGVTDTLTLIKLS